ncbi:MAG: hydrogenase maturation nickel metallochaperone HypA [Thermodesulfovibrionia bacterium]|nr:hydrogenase maturation nickel metallochaperone HypA [Thermodesulfovibrionia bacterium]
MHEVSIVLGMIDELTKIAQEHNARKVVNVKLKIGAMSGIVTDSVRFAFDAVKYQYPLLINTEILIDEVPLIYECRDCKDTFKTGDAYFPSCPHCKSHNLNLISGEELHIETLEVEV